MAKPANSIVLVSVKLNVQQLWERKLGRKPIYRKYSSAKGAARDWAYRTANELYHNRPVQAPLPAGHVAGFVYEQPDFEALYNKAYRRSLKVFHAMGMK